jgi:hypothetical protein
MRYEDFIEKEIQKLGKVLIELMSFILKKPNYESNESIFQSVNKTLVDEIKYSAEDLILLNIEELIKIKGLNPDNMELLAGLLIEIGENADRENKKKYFNQALVILNHVDLEGNTFSLERFSKIEKLKKSLEIKD